MGRAREIVVKVLPSKIANDFVRKHHYSGKVVANSTLHFGCFLDGHLHGVLSYGNSMDKRKTMALVKDTGWNEFLELNLWHLMTICLETPNHIALERPYA